RRRRLLHEAAATRAPRPETARRSPRAPLSRHDGRVGLTDDELRVLRQQDPLRDEAVGRRRHLRHVGGVRRIALRGRRPRVAGGETLRLSPKEWDIAAGEVARITFAEARLAWIPPGVRP